MNIFRHATLLSRRIIFKRGLEEFIEKGLFEGKPPKAPGRAWRISEVRRKSFEDLEKLYFVLFKERNRLETYRTLARTMSQITVPIEKPLRKVRKSMARIKRTIAERHALARKMAKEEFEKKKAAGVYKWPPFSEEEIKKLSNK